MTETTTGPGEGGDAFAAAEHAAFIAFGDLADVRTIDRLRSALAAQRATLAAAGLLQDPETSTPEAAETAARFLAEASGCPWYEGDAWRLVLDSATEEGIAYARAIKAAHPTDDVQIRNIHHAHRVLVSAQRALSVSTPDDVPDTPANAAHINKTAPTSGPETP